MLLNSVCLMHSEHSTHIQSFIFLRLFLLLIQCCKMLLEMECVDVDNNKCFIALHKHIVSGFRFCLISMRRLLSIQAVFLLLLCFYKWTNWIASNKESYLEWCAQSFLLSFFPQNCKTYCVLRILNSFCCRFACARHNTKKNDFFRFIFV